MIDQPALLIDETKCKRNIAVMADKANRSGLILRPHFKTHQSTEIAEWFREAGVNKITVSSVTMAEYFAENGWDDILIAFPVNLPEIDHINELSRRINLLLTVESEFVVDFLVDKLSNKVGVYIEIDEGYHRTGIDAENITDIDRILRKIKNSDFMNFGGFMSHFGQTYSAKNSEEVRTIYKTSMIKLAGLKEKFKGLYPELRLSVGDTPSCSVLEDFMGADEIRPGNFIFFDVMQHYIGSCRTTDIAVALACPVVAVYPQRNEIAVYGGAVHLSKEFCYNHDGDKIFGLVVSLKSTGWDPPFPNTWVSRISQEHGIIRTTPELLQGIKPGDTVGILPVHSCLTANLANKYYSPVGQEIAKMRL